MDFKASEIRKELAKIAEKHGPKNVFLGLVVEDSEGREGYVLQSGEEKIVDVGGVFGLPSFDKGAFAIKIGDTDTWALIYAEEYQFYDIRQEDNARISMYASGIELTKDSNRLQVTGNASRISSGSMNVEVKEDSIQIGSSLTGGETLGTALNDLINAIKALTVVSPDGLLPVSPASSTQLTGIQTIINSYLK